MKITLLLTTVLRFLAVSSASAAGDASPMTLDSNSSDSAEAAYPVVLADVADDTDPSSLSADLAFDLPDYCDDDLDYDCYKKGVPKCCVKQRVACPSPSDGQPACDTSRRRGTNPNRQQRTSATIGWGGFCTAGVDTCVRGTSCLDGRCRESRDTNTNPNRQQRSSSATIGYGGFCKAGVDICVRGTSCLDGRCRESLLIPVRIRAGGDCRAGVDTCVRGYACRDEKCRRTQTLIRAGDVCQQGIDQCVRGHSCINGRCAIPGIRAGDVCQENFDQCIRGTSCINGRCAIPSQPRSDVCQSGSDCRGTDVCSNGTCRSGGQWYTNWQYCIMDCPSTDGACCGGSAQSWDNTYSSAEACCGQSAFNGNHQACLDKSNQCLGKDYNDELELVRSE